MLLGMDAPVIIALSIFVLTFLGITLEYFDKAVVALVGAVSMVLFRILTPEQALESIDFETIILLMSMMIIVEIATESKVFQWLNVRITQLTKGNPFLIMLLFVTLTMFMSAFLDNVTTVILIVPLTIALIRGLGRDPSLYVLCEIVFSNIGGGLTLIGDPPSIIIGTAASLGFNQFILAMWRPILACVAIIGTGVILKNWKHIKPKKDDLRTIFATNLLMRQIEYRFLGVTIDKKFLGLIMGGLIGTVLGFLLEHYIHLPIHVIALAGASISLLITSNYIHVHKTLEAVEWPTLFFFAGLFVVVGGIEHVGLLEHIAQAISAYSESPLAMLLIVMWSAGLLSMVLDNIPFVAVMIPVIMSLQTDLPAGFDPNMLWWALALGANLGGNGTLVGASANVVAAGIARKNGVNIGFGQYFKFGFPIALASLVICTIYFYIIL